MTGYVTSGRLMADSALETAIEARRQAHRYFRMDMPNTGKEWAGRALRAWQMYRYRKARIKQ